MNWCKLLILFLAASTVIAFCLDECPGQGRRPKQPKPEPKGPERNVPGWTEVSGSIPDDKEEAKKATVFEHFSATAECNMSKPFMVYFYWPDEGKKDKNATACAAFEKNLAAASDFQTAAADFGCYKCNAKDIDKKLKSKYGVKTPLLLFFDATGKKRHKITKFPKSDKSLVKKLKKIKENSDKAVEKAKEKEEKRGK